ncbi:putative siderophore iron transporter [Aaosphaeria arxii CBS 175.79]|uniref:Putative siderophore iron transporter n=1 Tax=Aaosphaeria arxii CBS 175.79 TaxID=1450172 RepID=A0A6A5X799_9PLEO|nr:putative siderophore iron transporter [Aaosphaeria arxii CBS 175.79]KAF2008792.1 putative siderophore iron transporter [Aaosphaeria arxii CBS 175.79]
MESSSNPCDRNANAPALSNNDKDRACSTEHREHIPGSDQPDQADVQNEPELHWRTYCALFALIITNYVAVISLQAPPAVLNYIGSSLGSTEHQAWIINAPNLVCAAVGPILSSASDIFQARKHILLGGCAMGVIGCAIVPGSKDIYRVIAGQTIVGFGYATTPLLYAIPSEILPKKWRPIAQAIVNVAAAIASITGPLAIGALTRRDMINGWRRFWWIEMAMWAASLLSLLFGYNPPRRETAYESPLWYQKLAKLDIPGSILLTASSTLLLVGLGLGGSNSSWTSARTLSTLIIGGVLGVIFGFYEWKGTTTGILHHELFLPGKDNGRTFALCIALFGVEAILIVSFIVFYPLLTQALYETDVFLLVARSMPYWVAAAFGAPFWGYLSTRFRTIKWPMICGFIIWGVGTIGLATLQPKHDFNAMAFAAVSGFGFGAPLVMIVTGVQLSVPHHLIATATSVATSSRALCNTTFTSIYVAILTSRLSTSIPRHVPPAIILAGLPIDSVAGFMAALASGQLSALTSLPGVTPAVIEAGVAAYKQAYADSIRVLYIITAAITAVATIAAVFISNMRERMTNRIDAPVEEVLSKGTTHCETGLEKS